MFIGIIKNGERILGHCELKDIINLGNPVKTIICNGIIANAVDKVIYLCEKCNKEVIETRRSLCDSKKYRPICMTCKTKETSLKKYGTESPNQVPEIKRKQQGTTIDYCIGNDYPQKITENIEELYELRSKNTKKRWENGAYTDIDYSTSKIEQWKSAGYRDKMKISLNSPIARKRKSDASKRRWKEEPDKMLKGLIKSCSKRFSKIHQKIETLFNLPSLGFLRDHRVGRYIADEVHLDKKVIIEANGDYIHANPKFYKSNDVILLPGNKYTAQEKWDYDAARTKKLEDIGYKVIILWESDTEEEMKEKMKSIV